MCADKEWFNFYGVGRDKVAGKHPGELMSEGEQLTFDEAEARAKELSALWSLDVEVVDEQKSCQGFYYRDSGFKWEK